MIKSSTNSLLEKRLAEARSVLASRDYQVIKASRLGVPVEQLYPGHAEWYEEAVAGVRSIEEKIRTRDAAPLA
jgi:hypothetical protein